MATESCDELVEHETVRQSEKLKILSSPSVIEDLTDDQARRNADQKAARYLFDKFLKAYRQLVILRRRRRDDKNSDDENSDDDDSGDDDSGDDEFDEESVSSSQTPDFFRFLDLPAELRNMVYEIHCAEHRKAHRIREQRYRHKISGIQGPPHKRNLLYEELSFQNRTRIIGSQIWRNIIKLQKAFNSSIEPYEEYEIQHQYRGSCKYEHESHFYVSWVSVNARGNLCESLPPLLLASRKLFSEAWASNFSARPDRLKYGFKIRNFSVFPFFRLVQLLQRQDIQIHGNMVHMELQDERDDDRCYNKNEVKTKEDEMSGDSDDERRSSRYATRFRRLARLFGLHWLQGVPLWNCFTNARRDWCQGDDDKITLGVWFYSIRQIVALHRIEISKWRDLSTQLLRGHDVIHNDEWFWPLSDSSLIENVISVFNEALEYRVGRKGRYAQGRYGDAGDGQGPHEAKTSARQSPMSRFASYDLIVTEREHAIVHIVNLYRVKINGALRLEFGNVYEEWELAEDEKKIPEDVIF